jgi:hypothetical protein
MLLDLFLSASGSTPHIPLSIYARHYITKTSRSDHSHSLSAGQLLHFTSHNLCLLSGFLALLRCMLGLLFWVSGCILQYITPLAAA